MQNQLLGGLSAQAFLRHHWQRRPLLVRGALPRWRGVATRKQLLRLAARPDVESRFVRRAGTRWRVEQGPFARLALQRNSTLLVNGVNLHLADADRLLRAFAFLPQARRPTEQVRQSSSAMPSWPHPGGR
jgi:50S ribosomal protein L16 3-hydroxylase